MRFCRILLINTNQTVYRSRNTPIREFGETAKFSVIDRGIYGVESTLPVMAAIVKGGDEESGG